MFETKEFLEVLEIWEILKISEILEILETFWISSTTSASDIQLKSSRLFQNWLKKE